jgi:hypothetical protein
MIWFIVQLELPAATPWLDVPLSYRVLISRYYVDPTNDGTDSRWWLQFMSQMMSATMLSLYSHVFSHQAAFRRLSFQRSVQRVTYPSQRAPFPSPLRTLYLSRHVTPSRVAATVGAGLAGAGLGLSFYANFQNLNCECEPLLISGQ